MKLKITAMAAGFGENPFSSTPTTSAESQEDKVVYSSYRSPGMVMSAGERMPMRSETRLTCSPQRPVERDAVEDSFTAGSLPDCCGARHKDLPSQVDDPNAMPPEPRKRDRAGCLPPDRQESDRTKWVELP